MASEALLAGEASSSSSTVHGSAAIKRRRDVICALHDTEPRAPRWKSTFLCSYGVLRTERRQNFVR